MKAFMCCVLILPFVTMVMTATVRAQRDVLSFITDELEKTRATEKTIPANITGYRKPPSKPVTEEDSEDMSEAKSKEGFATNGFTEPEVSNKNGGESRDSARDLDSHEIVIPTVVEKDKALSRRKTGADKESVGLMDKSRRLGQDHWSIEQNGPHGPHQESRQWTDFHSDEEMMLAAHEVETLPGKQVIHLRGDRVTDSASQGASLQRKPGRVDVLNGMLARGESRELLDQDSLERNGRPVPVVNSRDTDYDETREYVSSETYPLAPPEQMPSSLSVPAKSRVS